MSSFVSSASAAPTTITDDRLHPDPGLQSVGIEHTDWPMARYEEEVKHHPASPVAYLERGNASMCNGDMDKAMADFNRAIQLDPHCTRAYIGRYYCYLDASKDAQGIAELKKAQQVGPPDLAMDALNLQANLHKHRQEFQLANEEFTRVIKANLFSKRRLASVYLNRGVTFDRLHKPELANKDYSMAIKLNPNLGTAYVYRANNLRDLGDIKGALADYKVVTDYIESNKSQEQKKTDFVNDRKDVYKFRAILWSRIGRKDLAKADETRALRQDREDIDLSPFQLK